VVESEQNKRLKGVVTDRDITIRAVAEGKDANSTKVLEVMTSGVETCNQNDTVQDILNLMEREQVRRVPITDREGRLVGIVAQADVATELTSSHEGMHEVADTLERISEPGRPRQGGGAMRGSQSRGGAQGGGRTGGTQAGGMQAGGMQAGGASGSGSSVGRSAGGTQSGGAASGGMQAGGAQTGAAQSGSTGAAGTTGRAQSGGARGGGAAASGTEGGE
jgi:hypothetical protein